METITVQTVVTPGLYSDETELGYAKAGDAGIDLINTPALNLALQDNAYRMATYGLAINYGQVGYHELANLTAPSECRFTVTICGQCRNTTDLGNLMFGLLLNLAGWQPDILIASLGFNLGDASFAVDSAGILAGYLLPDMLRHVGSGQDSFCQAIQVADTMLSWRDHVNPQCSEPNPVEIPTSNYRSRPPHWNRYISSEFPSYQLDVSFENPARALEAMSRGLIDVPE